MSKPSSVAPRSRRGPARNGPAAPTIGLVVNPVAGLGGRLGLHGSDTVNTAALARARGVASRASERAAAALAEIGSCRLLTAGGEMGARAATLAGCGHTVVYRQRREESDALDTCRAVEALLRIGVELVLFCGGDGTARDVMQVAGEVPVLGIPAGVKMHSGVFALSPRAAGRLARAFLAHPRAPTQWREVVDVDERWQPVLHGELLVPSDARLLQHPKRRPHASHAQLSALGRALVDELQDGVPYLIGPGRTAGSVLTALGIEATTLGVHVIRNGALAVCDASEAQILQALDRAPDHGAGARIIISPVGGQGFLLGRGNQQLSSKVLNRIGPDRIRVVASAGKLHDLRGQPLVVELDDDSLIARFPTRIRVLTAPRREVLYPVLVLDAYSARELDRLDAARAVTAPGPRGAEDYPRRPEL